MLCLQCRQRITQDNRQRFKLGLRLPYCADCVQAYIMRRELGRMSGAQRRDAVNKARDALAARAKTEQFSPKDVADARTKLEASGYSEEEINNILSIAPKPA